MAKRLFKSIVILAVLLLSAQNVLAQTNQKAKKPIIMVLPADNWCIRNNFVTAYDDAGETQLVPDYKKVVQNSVDMLAMMSGIGDFMKNEGFPLKSLEQSLKNLEDDAAFNMVNTSKSGSEAAISPKDEVLSNAKPDIILYLGFEEKKMGPRVQIDFHLTAVDAYSSKEISGNNGQGTPSTPSQKTNQLQEAVLSFKDKLISDLMMHFEDMAVNGREIVVEVRRWDSCDIDFEEEFDDTELGEIIEEWMANNTVNGAFSTSVATENYMKFEQVRIPLFNEKGRAIDARAFGGNLRKYIKQVTGQECKNQQRGLGLVTVIMGEK